MREPRLKGNVLRTLSSPLKGPTGGTNNPKGEGDWFKTSRPPLLRGVCAQKGRKHWSCIDHPCPIRKGDTNLVGIHPIRAIMGDRMVLCVPRGRRYLRTPSPRQRNRDRDPEGVTIHLECRVPKGSHPATDQRSPLRGAPCSALKTDRTLTVA